MADMIGNNIAFIKSVNHPMRDNRYISEYLEDFANSILIRDNDKKQLCRVSLSKGRMYEGELSFDNSYTYYDLLMEASSEIKRLREENNRLKEVKRIIEIANEQKNNMIYSMN